MLTMFAHQYLIWFLQMIVVSFVRHKRGVSNHSEDIKEYDDVSNQVINFQKYSIQFGHKIKESSL